MLTGIRLYFLNQATVGGLNRLGVRGRGQRAEGRAAIFDESTREGFWALVQDLADVMKGMKTRRRGPRRLSWRAIWGSGRCGRDDQLEELGAR